MILGRKSLAALVLALSCHGLLLAQGLPSTGIGPAAPRQATAAAPAGPKPQPVAVGEIAQQAEAGMAAIRQIEGRERSAAEIASASAALPGLERETTGRLQALQRLDASAFSLETIRGVDDELRNIEQRVSPLLRDLTDVALRIDRDLKQLEALDATWTATIDAAIKAGAPPDILERAQDLAAAMAETRKNVLAHRTRVLALQGQATDIGTRLAEIRQLLTVASERAATRLLYRDGPPLWSATFWTESIHSFSANALNHIGTQASALTGYLKSAWRLFALHASVLVLLTILLSVARRKVNELVKDDAGLRENKKIFDMPIVTATLVAMLLSSWFYPNAPNPVWLLIGILSTVPLVIFARRMIDPAIYRLLLSVVIFYLADKARALFTPLPGVYRFLLLLEVLGVFLAVLPVLRRRQAASEDIGRVHKIAWQAIEYGGWITLFASLIILAAVVSGYARLADLMLRTMLSSAYTAMLLYALCSAAEGLVHGLLYMPPVSFLAGVQRHRMQIAMRINKWLKWIAFLFWIVVTLLTSGLLQRVIAWLESLWNVAWKLGNLTIAVSEVALFILILWLTYAISRLTRFLLEEEIFSRLRLDRGLPYALSTTVHYVILLSGLVMALAAIGVDMTKFTIVAGALTVGIGFGLQNIVNNFVSGLIVLFERPVKIGDTIQIDDMVGRVQHIGIRATVIQSTAGAEVIIPNGKLISEKLTNWTLSNQLHQISVPVVTKPDINVARLKATLLEVGRWNKKVLETPAPEVLFIKRGVDAYEFELRVWTGDFEGWLKVKSDLITSVNDALQEKEISAEAQPPDVKSPPP
ncbi:mechanosensitive ion channel domain-containing protein [Janthinobacterium sp. 17J80-10]|uniref:mechanosensitive ion channel family protein n=1 Tax=Janthinobacterium sp. 17J80-10 TaxID=2497863 RepID=UPI0010057C34|nr:mechanosensitive ion channel domain-containing protein [Janthinobacterium sp. 17J80-10]QAU34502.1 mechanosensitive ion channel [Janthinobacterium sp. 17J80-10]